MTEDFNEEPIQVKRLPYEIGEVLKKVATNEIRADIVAEMMQHGIKKISDDKRLIQIWYDTYQYVYTQYLGVDGTPIEIIGDE